MAEKVGTGFSLRHPTKRLNRMAEKVGTGFQILVRTLNHPNKRKIN
ncbi:hypothetical protein [Sphingorhabdus lutea]|nr:hypothetical protein [Sphingorhabdus lutea]